MREMPTVNEHSVQKQRNSNQSSEKIETHLQCRTLVVTMCTFLLSRMSVRTDLAASKIPHASMPSSKSMYFGGPEPGRD